MAATVISGASRGLGMTLLDCLLERGHTVLGLARSFPDRLEELAAAQPARLRLRACDLRAPEDVPTASELAGFLDSADDLTLINNAATVDPLGAVGSLPAAQLLAAITVNLIGPMLLTNAFLAAIRDPAANPAEQGVVLRQSIERVRIIFITSSVATRPKPGNSAYGASKAGGEAFFATLRAEQQLDPRLLVEVIDPGGMDTDMHAAIRNSEGVYFPDRGRLRDVAASGRLTKPEVVAERILNRELLAL